MKVLDLFSGLGGWSVAFRDRSHTVTTLDLDPRFHADHVRDLMTVNDLAELGGPFDVVLASPPCECFSVMTIGRNWNKDRTPKERPDGSNPAKAALALAWHTFDLIDRYLPTWYIVENPRGMLRKVAPRPPEATTWYCRWGTPYAKPTDLWTNLNGRNAIGWPSCANRAPDHPFSPRGDKENSVQGAHAHRERRQRLLAGENVPGWKITERGFVVRTGGRAKRIADGHDDKTDAALRALIPYRLSLAVCLACERDGVLPAMDEVVQLEADLRQRQGVA